MQQHDGMNSSNGACNCSSEHKGLLGKQMACPDIHIRKLYCRDSGNGRRFGVGRFGRRDRGRCATRAQHKLVPGRFLGSGMGGLTGTGTRATAAGKRLLTSTTDLPSSNGHRELVTRVGLALHDRADPVDQEAQADRAGLADLENPAGLAAPVAPVDTNRVDLVDTNRAALGVMADTGLADREGPANRVDLEDRVDRVDLEDLEDRGSPVDLVDTNRAVRGLRGRVRVAQDLGQSRALLGRTAPSRAHLRRAVLSRAHLRRNLPDPDLTRARPHRMPAHLHLTQARLHQIPARLRAPTHPGVATHLPVRTRQAEAFHPVAATPVAATHPGEAIADTEGAMPRDCESIWHSSGFGCCTQLCI